MKLLAEEVFITLEAERVSKTRLCFFSPVSNIKNATFEFEFDFKARDRSSVSRI